MIRSAPPHPTRSRPPALFRARALAALALLSACVVVASAARADWTASGRFEYTDRLYDLTGFTGTAPMPVRSADVEVYDLGSLAVLASGATDANGDFSLLVTDAATRDIGVRVLASTGQTVDLFFSVVDDSSGNAIYGYHDAASDVSTHSPTANVDFGTLTMPAAIGTVGTTDWSSQVFNLFDMALVMTDWITFVDGIRPSVGFTIAWNPTSGRGGSFYTSGNNLLTMSDDDGYDDPNILHELGHYVEDEFGASQNPGGTHFIGDDDQDLRLAWSEGVATFFSNAALDLAGRPRPDIYSDRNSFGASGGFSYTVESTVTGGATNELAVNAALWDIIDDTTSLDASPGLDDDALALADSLPWAVIEQLRVAPPAATSVEDFWDTWFGLALGSQGGMESVFATHSIDFLPDPQEPNDEPATATLLTTGPTYQENTFYDGGGVAGGDEDWFRFATTAGSDYWVEVSPAANTIFGRPDPEFYLLDGELTVLAHADDPLDTSLNDQASSTAQEMSESAPSALFRAASTGDHYVYLRHTSHPVDLDGRYGTYQVRVRTIAAPTPTISAVAAQQLLAGEVYPILVTGSNLAVGAAVSANDPGIVATSVEWLAPTALVATISLAPGVGAGAYDLTVSNPGGANATLPGALAVSASAAPSIMISEVELAADSVELRNRGGVPADLTGWELRSYRPAMAVQTYVFPAYSLAAGGTVVVSENGGVDTTTELYDQDETLNWPWLNGVGGGVSLIDAGGRNVDSIRWVDGPVDEHEAPLGTGGLWMQPEFLSPDLGTTISRAETTGWPRTRRGLSPASPTMPVGAAGRDNAVDAWENNDGARLAPLFSRYTTLNGLSIDARPGDPDEDWFGFPLHAGQDLSIDIAFSHATGDLDLEVYAPGDDPATGDPPLLSSISTTDDEHILLSSALTSATGGGVYRVRVLGWSGALNDYTLATTPPAVCGDAILGAGEACDDGNTIPGDCCSATCTIEPLGTVCRAAAGACDAEEQCDGIADSCPADAKLAGECRSASDVCDVPESCDGLADDCPTDLFEPASTQCRAAAGDCDAPEFCSGASAGCGADAKLTSECRAAVDLCDITESCDGVGDDCPSDAFEPDTTVCRASTGACDPAELCTGAGVACPSDGDLDGEPCPDGDLCNGDEVCVGFFCTSGTALDCDDLDPCTADACDAISGCSNTAIQGCAAPVPMASPLARSMIVLLMLACGALFAGRSTPRGRVG